MSAMRLRFPNESPEYRVARQKLLEREVALRREMESVAAELRALPPGGAIPEDYVLDRVDASGAVETVRFSALFGSRDTLMVYHYMFPRYVGDTRAPPKVGATAALPREDGPCPSCTALLDMWEGTLPHFEGLGGNLVVVARAPIERVTAFARDKGWKNVRLLSAGTSSFRRDYGGDDEDGHPVPILTVFRRDDDGTIRLHWASELIHAPSEPGQDPRHLGTVEPLWTLFDLTPGGRPAAEEEFAYPCCRS
jgi:predicted dithiol-disulfide oxidoreductase (DUF899 family)